MRIRDIMNGSRRRRRPRHDVVFYTPLIGSMLTMPPGLSRGGTETQVLILAPALARLGAEVAIIVFDPGSEIPLEIDGVRISTRLPHVTGRGIRGKAVEVTRIWNSLRRVRPRTIIHYGAGLELGVIALYARLTRRRLVYASASEKDFDYRAKEPNRLYCLLFELGVRLADTIVVQTEEQVELCRTVFARKSVVIKSFAPAPRRQRDAPVAFLWVGRLVSFKRPLEYVALARALPEAKFWMVGVPIPHQESDRLVMEAVLEECRSIPNLELLPPRPHRELQSLMERAVASVSTSEFEGMPNVLLEAWSRGVPALVLSYDPGGVVSTYGLGGFAAGSRARFAALARDLWLTRDDRAELSQRCRAYIQAHHAPETVAAQWYELLHSTKPSGATETGTPGNEPATSHGEAMAASSS